MDVLSSTPEMGALPTYLSECVEINEIALQEEFMRLPADYAFWAQNYAEARHEWRKSKAACDSEKSRLYLEHREQLKEIEARVTETMIASCVETDPSWALVKGIEIGAEAEMKRVEGVLEALKTKREMLISLGAHARAEMKTIV